MDFLDNIDKKELKDFLAKGWLTHDGLWFYHISQEVGIQKANLLNKAAIRDLAAVETHRALKLLGRDRSEIDTFARLRDFMLGALAMTMPSSIMARMDFRASEDNILHWEWEQESCFAYKGIKLIGLLDQYSCGVMYRIECWLEALGVRYVMEPKIDTCIMHTHGHCRGEIRILSFG